MYAYTYIYMNMSLGQTIETQVVNLQWPKLKNAWYSYKRQIPILYMNEESAVENNWKLKKNRYTQVYK